MADGDPAIGVVSRGTLMACLIGIIKHANVTHLTCCAATGRTGIARTF
jgi:hypothetical protein